MSWKPEVTWFLTSNLMPNMSSRQMHQAWPQIKAASHASSSWMI